MCRSEDGANLLSRLEYPNVVHNPDLLPNSSRFEFALSQSRFRPYITFSETGKLQCVS